MKLNIIVDGRQSCFEIPDYLLTDAQDFFKKINADMDKGWQMSRDWVQNPTAEQRCQIAADKILTAIDTDNEKLVMLMAAYIIHTIPRVKTVHIDNTGDMNETDIILGEEEHNPLAVTNKPLGPIF